MQLDFCGKIMATKSIFVTGANGFIGSHLAERLVEEGYKVKALSEYNSFNDIGWLKDAKPNMSNQLNKLLRDKGKTISGTVPFWNKLNL